LLASRASKRTFSSRATSPGCSAATVALADSPVTSEASFTSVPSSSPSRLATGAREPDSSNPTPFGRPRWATQTTFAPDPVRALIVGRLATMRPSSVMTPEPSLASGTLKSALSSTVLPAMSRSLIFFTGNSLDG
jgi:hypothetical protein